MKIRLLSSLIISAAIAVPAIAAECADESEWAKLLDAKKVKIRTQVESQIDTSVDVANSPFIYTNPDAGCDLGFTMPGLPGFGISGIDACKLLKSVTGEMVSDINKTMKDSLDSTLESVIGTSDSQNLDLQNVAEDAIKGN